MINMHTEFEVSSLSRSRDILGGLKNLNGPRDVMDGLLSVGWDLLFSTDTPNFKCLRLPATKI